MRVAMTESGDSDPTREIEKFPTVGGIKIEAFAPFDGNIPPTVGRHNCWYHGSLLRDLSWGKLNGNAGLSSSPEPRTRGSPVLFPTPARFAGIALHRALSLLRRAGSAAPSLEQESDGVWGALRHLSIRAG